MLLTVSVAFPDVAMLVGLIVAERPDDGVTVRETVPENPLIALTVIVEVIAVPLGVVKLDGMAFMVKSGAGLLTVTETVTGWDSVPLVPTTCAVYDPLGVDVVVDTVSVVVPVPPDERVTLVALRVVVGPDGDMEDVRVIVPVKPLILVRVIEDAAEEPAWIVRLTGLTAMVKSGGGGGLTATVIVAEWTSVPLVPLTVTE